jgi:hypothetical protein
LKYERWLAVFDTHGDHIDWPAANGALEFCKHFKPHHRIHGGDYADLRPLRQGASAEEAAEGLEDDVDATVDFITKFKPTDVLDGNHDYRLKRATESKHKALAEFAARLVVDLAAAMGKARRYPWDKRDGVMQLGDLRIIHGYHGGLTAAKQAAAVYGNVIQGHTHTVDVHSQPGIEKRVGRCCGALCQLSADYNRGQANTLRQSHGFAYGLLFPNGKTLVWQAERIDGNWFLPSEFREFRAS